MTHHDGGRRATTSARAEQVSKLLQQALSEPGVREAMEVYERWQTLDTVTQAYTQAMSAKQIVSVSNRSDPSGEHIY